MGCVKFLGKKDIKNPLLLSSNISNPNFMIVCKFYYGLFVSLFDSLSCILFIIYVDVTKVLCQLELTIKRVKVSTTPDGRVMDLFFITDTRFVSHAIF